jgi:hypothetical protein
MTVDMFIDFWQTRECALAAIEELIDQLEDFKDHPKYQEKMAALLESKEDLQKRR